MFEDDHSDPDQATTMSSTTTSSPAFRPKKPIMGDLQQVSSTDWCAWTGGRPKSDWTGLDPSAPMTPSNAYQYRPGSPGAAQKSTFYREQGLDIKFSKTSNLLEFTDQVKTYLE